MQIVCGYNKLQSTCTNVVAKTSVCEVLCWVYGQYTYFNSSRQVWMKNDFLHCIVVMMGGGGFLQLTAPPPIKDAVFSEGNLVVVPS